MTTNTVTGFDALRASQIAAILADQPTQLDRIGWDRARIEAHQRSALQDLLARAVEHSPFHARRLAGIDVTQIEPGDLSALPVMTKAEMMSSLDDVFTDRRLTRSLAEDALAATGSEPVPILDSYVAFTSGGSSGVRGVFVFDLDAMRQLVGAFSRNLVARIGTLGGPPPGGLPIGFVGAGCAVHLTGTASAMTVGGELGFFYVGLSATQPLPELVARLNELQLPAIAGYPSVLARLAHEQRAGRLQISPMVLTATSEPVTPELREAIRAGFGVPLANSFASTEGLMGASLPDDEAIVLAEDGCIVELVDEDNRPVAPGTPSAKVLVTNLANHLQPLIRYELTDRFVRLPDSPDHGYARVTVDGRSDDAFRFGDVTVHPLTVRSVLVKTPGVAEYQVRQTPRGVDVALVAHDAVDVEDVRERLAAALAAAGLAEPQVSAGIVPAVDRSAASGKCRRFVPLT
jgi:phenylacetate-coenzyme A ligase PaaK-like adenylate-forming protein